MKIRYIFSFIAVGALIGIVVPTLVGSSQKNKTQVQASPTPNSEDDMASHHASPAPADNSKFQSLLGKEAPDFNLENYSGKTVKLSDFRGKNLILFFNEGAMCYPSCWDQISAFEDSKFKDGNVRALSIVVDSKNDWKDVVQKMPKIGSAEVLFDSDRKVSTEYGVLTLASSMHRGQFPGHTYLILDKKGVIRFLGDDVQMGVRNSDLLTELNKIERKYQ